MGTIALKSTGTVSTIAGSATFNVFGSAPQWGDGSDSSGATVTTTTGSGILVSAIEPLVLPAGATVTGVRGYARAAAATNTQGSIFVRAGADIFDDLVVTLANHPDDPSNSTWTLDVSGVAVDYDLNEAGFGDADLVSSLEAGAFVFAKVFFGAGVLTVYEFTLFVDYDGGTVDLPCDTWVDLDLSAAVILEDGSGNATGIYGDGVIYGNEVAGTALYPDLSFTGVDLDPAKPYLVESTYDPGSGHDFGGRGRIISAFRPGLAQADLDAGGAFGNLYSGFLGSVADTLQVKVGPGIEDWDDATYGVAQGYTTLAFQSDRIGALSAVRIRKLCTFGIPPLRLTNRDDRERLTNRRSRQGSNRLTGYL